MSDPGTTALTQARALLEKAAAERRSNPRSPARRDILKRMISLTRSPYAPVKRFVAENLRSFFKDFPALQDEVIDCVYDLCEDANQDVRVSGYRAIVELSRAENKWTKRNTDVLLQLLQSDDPVELGVVTQALVDHVQIEPQAALAVMCDHCFADGPLRKPVIELFLSQPDVTSVLRGPNDEAERVFIDGLKKVLPKVSPADAALIIDKLLLPRQSIQNDSNEFSNLRGMLTAPMREAVKNDQAKPTPWTYPSFLPFAESTRDKPSTSTVKLFKETVLIPQNIMRTEPTVQARLLSVYFQMLLQSSNAERDAALSGSAPLLQTLNASTATPQKEFWSVVEQVAHAISERSVRVPPPLTTVLTSLRDRAISEPKNLAGAALRELRSALNRTPAPTGPSDSTSRKRKLEFPEISPPSSPQLATQRPPPGVGMLMSALTKANAANNVGGGYNNASTPAPEERFLKRVRVSEGSGPDSARWASIEQPARPIGSLVSRIAGMEISEDVGKSIPRSKSAPLLNRIGGGAAVAPAAAATGVRPQAQAQRQVAGRGAAVAGRRPTLLARMSGTTGDAMDVDAKPRSLLDRMSVGGRA
ncbi:apoptosis inhibitory protein 5-domain-containing protein [Auriculariales sp. MPI-PUGE-AT-0066]|nr:apoptosis inhibitory protein 5-domain-containing protein [Auriculariales sp. MPI-PUGE-AT-0066]